MGIFFPNVSILLAAILFSGIQKLQYIAQLPIPEK